MAFDSLNPNAGIPGFDSNGNPMSYGAGGSTTPAQSVVPQVVNPNSAPTTSGAQDYLSQQQQMLAKYQAMANRAYPSNPLFGNSAFAANHPRLAGVLGNVLLTGSMIGPSRTVGEGISNVARGLIGASQWGPEQDLKRQMLPIQLMNQNLGMQKNIADIGELNARSAYYGQEGQWRQSEIAKANFPHAISGPKVDDQGKQWQTVMDPATGAVTDKPVGWTPQEGYQPTFKNEEKNQRMSTPGGLEGEIMSNLMSTDPALQAQGAAQKKIYMDIAAGRAGATTAAQQAAPHQQQDYDTFINDQKTNAFKDIKPPETDFNKYWAGAMLKDKSLSDPEKAAKAQQSEIDQYRTQLQNRNSNFANWTQTDAHKGIPFDPNKPYSARNSKAPATTTTAPARKNPFAQ